MEPKRIVLTGASRGLGRAMAERFIAEGHTICGCARSAATMAEMAARWGAPHSFDVIDVANDEQVRHWAERILAAEPIDLLLNNAALINRSAVFWNVPVEEFDRLVDVNIKGVANVLRH